MTMDTRVWVVDDDASVRWVLDKALQAEGMSTRCFEGASELLHALGAESPDVLITDVRMPGMNGVELMEQIVHSAFDHVPYLLRSRSRLHIPQPPPQMRSKRPSKCIV